MKSFFVCMNADSAFTIAHSLAFLKHMVGTWGSACTHHGAHCPQMLGWGNPLKCINFTTVKLWEKNSCGNLFT